MSLTIRPVQAILAPNMQVYPQTSLYCVARLGQQVQRTRALEGGSKIAKWTDALQFVLSKEPYLRMELWDKNYAVAEGYTSLSKLYSSPTGTSNGKKTSKADVVELRANGVCIGRLQLILELVGTQPTTQPATLQTHPVNRATDALSRPTEAQKPLCTLAANQQYPTQPARGPQAESKDLTQLRTEQHYTYTQEISYQLKANYKHPEVTKPLLNPAAISLPEGFDPLAVDLNSIYDLIGNKTHPPQQVQANQQKALPAGSYRHLRCNTDSDYPLLESLENLPILPTVQDSIYPTFEKPSRQDKAPEKSAREQWEEMNNREYPTLQNPNPKVGNIQPKEYPQIAADFREHRKPIFSNNPAYPELAKETVPGKDGNNMRQNYPDFERKTDANSRHQPKHYAEIAPNTNEFKTTNGNAIGTLNYPGIDTRADPYRTHPGTNKRNQSYSKQPAVEPSRKTDAEMQRGYGNAQIPSYTPGYPNTYQPAQHMPNVANQWPPTNVYARNGYY